MDKHASAQPGKAHQAGLDSDVEADVYAYRSRQNERRRSKHTNEKAIQPLAAKPSRPGIEDDDVAQAAETGESTPSDGTGMLLDDHERRTPFYSYATEKSDSHADAKLFYQRHRMDIKAGEDAQSPVWLTRAATLPACIMEGDSLGLSRATSVTSRASNKNINGSAISAHTASSHEPFPPVEQQDAYLGADSTPRNHIDQNLHESKDPLQGGEEFHGRGAGVGVGSGAGGLARTEETIVSEVEAICQKIKTVLDLRRRYLKLSLQCPGDNPRDDESWMIYPPHPEPVWKGENERSVHDPPTRSSSLHKADHQASSGRSKTTSFGHSDNVAGKADTPASPTAPRTRKHGQAIGEDFEWSDCSIPGKSDLRFGLNGESVYQVYDKSAEVPIVGTPSLRDFYIALDTIQDIASDGPAKSFAYRRLQYLEGRYNLYTLLNEYEEVADTKRVPHRDFYNVRKVDTHVHHSACMNQKHLLRFIKSKMKKSPDEVVLFRDGRHLTLREVFESINLTAYDLSIDTLDMHAHTDSFHRFDKFNLKYNPIGQSRLREIFLKTDNFIQGRYLADLTREVIADLESSKYQMVEWRISIYGRNAQEWDKLAAWVVDNKLFSHNVRWLIQIPRLYDVYKASKVVEDFESVVINIFRPLFEVTHDPASHPKLHVFLQRVIGFDSVDDESKVERRFFRKYPIPKIWNYKQNPPYGYWIYYLFSNMASLNAFRQRRGFNTFLLRPHCGEAGDTDHLAAAILCCHSISHGITLRKVPILQYVFYLDQIGIAMSPLSNNALFLTYDRNPFVNYFRKGMNVSLSTDDPLQFAFTKEPLIEEYSVAAQIYKFSAVDMCELAKHSVDQSGFELSLKRRWLGKCCYLPGVLGNDVAKGNVPDIREAFRHETLKAEHSCIAKYTGDYSHFHRYNPAIPEDADPETPIEETLGSPKQYYATVADSVPPSQTARKPRSTSSVEFEAIRTSPRHFRTVSRASTLLHSATELGKFAPISGTEPRIFPGVVHERARRRSLRVSTSGSESATDRETISSSAILGPTLAKMSVKEGDESTEMENSD